MRLCFIFILVLIFSSNVIASPITFGFDGHLRMVDIPTALYSSLGKTQSLPFLPGDPITGSYTFDIVSGETVPDAYSTDGRVAYRWALIDWNITIGSYAARYDGEGINMIEIFDRGHIAGSRDIYHVQSYGAEGDDIEGMVPSHFSIGLSDPSSGAVTTTDLPLIPPDLSLFDTRNISLSFRSVSEPELYERAWGIMDEIYVIEANEPSICFLFSLGCSFVFWRFSLKKVDSCLIA